MSTNYFIVPGLGNSLEGHWQTWLEGQGDNFRRIDQKNWDAPDRQEWISNIDAALEGYPDDSIVLIGHSLGCMAIVHWAAHFKKKIKGALLVAPSDLEAPAYVFPHTGFLPMDFAALNFPAILVTASDDPWVSPERASFFARSWGAAFINIGSAGHINVATGFGAWPQVLPMLKSFDTNK